MFVGADPISFQPHSCVNELKNSFRLISSLCGHCKYGCLCWDLSRQNFDPGNCFCVAVMSWHHNQVGVANLISNLNVIAVDIIALEINSRLELGARLTADSAKPQLGPS